MDIFLLLKETVGCEYISDLHIEPYNRIAKRLLKSIVLEEYSLHTITDLINYIYDEKIDFATIAQVKEFLKKKDI